MKRQFGSERDTTPLPIMHPKPSDRTIALSRVAIVATVLFWLMYVVMVTMRLLIDGPDGYEFTLEVFGYLTVVTLLTLSALGYLIARHGAFQRFRKHARTPQVLLDKHFATHPSSITVLVPSYSEEVAVIRKTLLSAALQEFQDIRVVLLLDDNPFNIKPADAGRMKATRALSGEIDLLLSKPHQRFFEARSLFIKASNKNKTPSTETILEVSREYAWAADWLNTMADNEAVEDHTDVFFIDQVLRELATELKQIGEDLHTQKEQGFITSPEQIEHLYNRLVWIFGAKLDLFERKKYISLSHERNKAMNLNSYISLMGGMYATEETSSGLILSATDKEEEADIIARDSDFILTLDADSVLLREYCSRLVYLLQQPDNTDVAVVQTPYSSFRGSPTRLERLSGATTDIQHIIHQGMTYHNATFWVGANAVIRKNALDDIVETEWIGGFEIKRYVQDRTVIEDTESSIDLAVHGWRLVNYPERLSYSATPPDFGTLVIQRRRWANGGLLILPKLWEFVRIRKNKGNPVSKGERLLRINYMASIAWSNLGLIFLLAYPYDGRLLSPFILLAAMPYFISMAVDLKYCRYRYSDIMRIYGFNLILLPVNIAGTFKSIEQAITTKKIPFARTPKVKNRTATGLPFVLSPLLIVGFSLFTLWRNIQGEDWGNAAFAAFNAFSASWAIVSYIGVGNMFVDIWAALVDMVYIETKPKKARRKKAESGFELETAIAKK